MSDPKLNTHAGLIEAINKEITAATHAGEQPDFSDIIKQHAQFTMHETTPIELRSFQIHVAGGQIFDLMGPPDKRPSSPLPKESNMLLGYDVSTPFYAGYKASIVAKLLPSETLHTHIGIENPNGIPSSYANKQPIYRDLEEGTTLTETLRKEAGVLFWEARNRIFVAPELQEHSRRPKIPQDNPIDITYDGDRDIATPQIPGGSKGELEI